jgi:predicted SAM-dependent methyltransferase
MNLLKLNLGCGFDRLPGYVNIDKEAACEPDQVVDLESTWPFKTNSVEEIRASHVLEHLGQETRVFLGIMKEMYRVCRDGARIYIQVPHHDHWTFHADPTHVRKILPEGLKLFDQELNRQHIEKKYANTALGIYCQVDFVLEKAVPSFDEPWASRIQNNLVAQYDLNFAANHYTNAIVQWDIVLRVRKERN